MTKAWQQVLTYVRLILSGFQKGIHPRQKLDPRRGSYLIDNFTANEIMEFYPNFMTDRDE